MSCLHGKKNEKKLSLPLSALKGVGPRRSALLERLGLRTLEDLLFFFPRRYEDRRNVKKIAELVPGVPSVVYAAVSAVEVRPLPGRGRLLTTCRFSDGSGFLDAVWFNRRGLDRILAEGVRAALYGTPSLRASVFEMTEPEFELIKSEEGGEAPFSGIFPIYPSTEGLPRKWFRGVACGAVKEYHALAEEELPASVIEKNGLMPISRAIYEMHMPGSPESWKEARRRLAYGELFALHLTLAASRKERAESSSPRIVKGPLFEALIAGLPFKLTGSQRRVIEEIFADGASGRPISRLLQGDVGCGKTLVAVAFAAGVCDGGAQCAVLAPTEVLAEQLYRQAVGYLAPLGVKCALIKSNLPARERKEALDGLAEGFVGVVAGTQALFSDEIKFKNLGAVIIDEQQRFGVRQRARLLKNGARPHLLMMSATPIPRTMALTLYGDLDISVIEDKPAGRAPVETRIIGGDQLIKLMRFIAEEIVSGGRVYWICPRVEEDGNSGLPAAVKRFEWLGRKLPPVKMSLIHGQMESAEKDEALSAFREGRSQLLVGTTVLEVGVDVPEATVIVIESPERYGLSQLHQMRGRVGRGARRGLCVLLSMKPEDTERLRIFASTNDGFEIARADLELRGAGEIAGTAQHGLARFRVADLQRDCLLAERARDDAREFLEKEGTAALTAGLRAKIEGASPENLS